MSKKPQPQVKENPKNKIQIVEQQNEPFLKALQKRVRNINKKLTEITELETRDNLKPEQIEKVNRKTALLDERTRIQETATLFKDTYTENAAVYRNQQLKELEVLARALSIYHSGAKAPEQEKLAALWRVLQQSDKTYSSLNESIAALSSALKDFANDRNLQRGLTAYVDQHGSTLVQANQINQEKIVSDILQDKKEDKPEIVPVKEEAPAPSPVIISVPEVVAQPEVPAKVEEPAVEQQKVIFESPILIQGAPVTLVLENKGQTTEGDKKKNNYNRDRPRKQGGYKEKRDDDHPRERKYRPKYEEKKEEDVAAKEEKDNSSSDSEPEARNFRKEEIKKLQEEGFIVIGKPKPKAKDTKELQSAHNKQHGNKLHHRHHGPNS